MPLYDFQCPNCRAIIEEIVLVNSDKIFRCSMCDVEMKKMFPFTTAIRFGDSFLMGRDKQPKEITEKIEGFKEHPEKDPYGRWRNK